MNSVILKHNCLHWWLGFLLLHLLPSLFFLFPSYPLTLLHQPLFTILLRLHRLLLYNRLFFHFLHLLLHYCWFFLNYFRFLFFRRFFHFSVCPPQRRKRFHSGQITSSSSRSGLLSYNWGRDRLNWSRNRFRNWSFYLLNWLGDVLLLLYNMVGFLRLFDFWFWFDWLFFCYFFL